MSLTDRQEGLLIAIALTEFSVHYEQADPELAEHAWQLAASRLVDHDVGPAEASTHSRSDSYRSAFDRLKKPQKAARMGAGGWPPGGIGTRSSGLGADWIVSRGGNATMNMFVLSYINPALIPSVLESPY
ncbi:hypothetical protein [Natrinema sp. DC36]|uniref:hypothetical protein n=1 Tax=Natrinema sp. DC36 TaxID=2878680 RepID=UPI001CEFFBC3|nr:hypothetical protein [Natrinema sp. DC36]